MINCDQYIIKHRGIPDFTEELAQSVGNYGDPDRVLNIKWGDPQKAVRFGILESGFLWDGLHWDTVGLYQYCSLGLPSALRLIKDFRPKVSAREIMQTARVPSKFAQPDGITSWHGVVLALQNPTDRSILIGAHERDYYRFVEAAAEYYGSQLFMKLHPWNKNEIEDRFREIADRHGCKIGKVNHSVLDNCQFCLIYNSTFAFDCFLRGIPVVQFAPGYFWQTGAVQYTSRTFIDEIDYKDLMIRQAHALTDFCVWRYMVHCKMKKWEWQRLIKHLYDHQDEMFPVTEELSYAQSMLTLAGH